jgi:hypothetical protein
MKDDLEDTLRGCPFCGDYRHLKLEENQRGEWRVICPICDITGRVGDSRAEAANGWNIRFVAESLNPLRDILLDEGRKEP